ncbi:MAG: terminase large subunit, partial [Thermohalobaculum sp.]
MTAGPLAGTKFRLRDWQREIIEAIYTNGADGRRLIRQVLITCPRGNGKTGLAAGLCLAHLMGPEAEPRGGCFSASASREMAALIFNEMEAIIIDTPDLAARVNVKRQVKTIEVLEGTGRGS